MHLHCPVCHHGWVFQDARGGYECTECDARFNIQREFAHGYGGPLGPLGWFDRLRVHAGRAILPRVTPEPEEADTDAEPVVVDS